MIENIPKEIKPILNDFIVKGKRQFLQSTRTIIPMSKKICELNDKILDMFTEVSTEHFRITTYQESAADRYNLAEIVMRKGYTKNLGDRIRIRIDLLIGAEENSFDKIFRPLDCSKYFSIYQDKLNVPVEDLLKEYETLRNTLRKKVALKFLTFLKLTSYYTKLHTAISNKWNTIRKEAIEIERIWNEKYPLVPGTEVKYKDRSQLRTGTVARPVELNIGIKPYIEIKSSAGRVIYRKVDECHWENKFDDTRLCKCIYSILGNKEIPEEWSENKLVFCY